MPDWVVPERWRAHAVPRRGGMTVPWPEPPADAVAELGRRLSDPSLGAVDRAEFNPGPRAEGLAFAAAWARGGEVTPRGAAAAALLLGDFEDALPAEAWVTRCGLVFAARAVAETASLIFHPFRRAETVYARSLDMDGLKDWWRWNSPERQRMNEDEQTLFTLAQTVRARLAAADDDDYAAALAALGEYRSGPLPQRIVTTFLAPTRLDWIDADIAAMPEWYGQFEPDHFRLGVEGRLHTLLVLSAAKPRQFRALDQAMDAGSLSVATYWISQARMLGTLADVLGTDMMEVLDQGRYGNLAGIRVSYRSGLGDEAPDVLMAIPSDAAMRRIVEVALGVNLAEFHRCGALTREPVRALRVLAEAERSRGDDWLPSIYRDVIATVPGTVLDGLPPDDRALIDEVLGDRSGLGHGLAARLDMSERQTNVFNKAADRRQAIAWLAAIPTDEALGLLAERADRKYVVPVLLKVTAKDPARALRVLAGWQADDEHRGSVVADVLKNLVLAHPRLSSGAGSALEGEARDRIARILAGTADTTPVAAHADVPAVLRTGAKARRLPGWIVVGALPGVRLRDGAALPEAAVRQLIDLIARSTFAAPHPDLGEVRAACDRADLAAFAWALFTQWRAAEHPSGDKQAMLALGLLGDDTTVPRVSALFGEWASSAAARVRTGIEVLGAIGTDVALTHLRRVARKARQKGFRRLAEEKLDRIAEVRGFSPAELADRIVPDLDVGADGRLLLDYGPRRFVVTFDQWLTPQISEETGRVLKRLPTPAAADDPDRAAEAQASYRTLKRELKDVAAERLRALEEAMLTGRTWRGPEFATLVRDHPLVRHIARALIWQAVGGPSFRIAEDRTLAGADDAALDLADGVTVRLYHPAAGDPDLTATWTGILEDYEVTQPFPQLGREVHSPTPQQAAAAELGEFEGAEVSTTLLYAMAARGWRFGDGHGSLVRDWPGGFTVTVTFGPDFNPMISDMSEPRILGTASLTAPPGATFGLLTPLAASETLRDLYRLAEEDRQR